MPRVFGALQSSSGAVSIAGVGLLCSHFEGQVISLSRWQVVVSRWYAEDLAHRSVESAVLNLAEAAAKAASHVRRQSSEADVSASLGHLLFSLLDLAARLRVCLSCAAWRKFPGVCPYCINGRRRSSPIRMEIVDGSLVDLHQCRCIYAEGHGKYIASDTSIEKYRMAVNHEILGLGCWEQILGIVYGQRHVAEGSACDLVVHLVEEVGEVLEDVRTRSTSVADELADVFSWVVSLANFLRRDGRYERLSLDGALLRFVREPPSAAAWPLTVDRHALYLR